MRSRVRAGYGAKLGLLGFPLGMGYSFCFGFVAFCAALPLVYMALELAVVLSLLLVAHGVALGFLASGRSTAARVRIGPMVAARVASRSSRP